MERIILLLQTFISNVEVWLGYLLTLITLISFIVAIAKSIKEKKFSKIKDYAIGFIKEAETLKAKDGVTPISGETKKEVVLAKIQTICANLKVNYKEEVWSKTVDQLVDFTLKVNSKNKETNNTEISDIANTSPII